MPEPTGTALPGRRLYVAGGTGRENIVVSTPVLLGDRAVAVESAHDISTLYADRREQFSGLRRISLLVLSPVAALVLLASFWLARPLNIQREILQQAA